MSNKVELQMLLIIFAVALIAFPIALGLFVVSGVDLRHRADKRQCEAGKVERCLAVARVYDDDSVGLVGFALSNAESARVYYDRACTLGAAAACARLGHLILHGAETAGDSKFSRDDAAHALAQGCDGGISDACAEAATAGSR